ncbi:(Fe-S)-binding protein [Planctomycetota bacterium]
MSRMITTFPKVEEFEKAKASLETLDLPYQVIMPDSGYECVDLPALVLDENARMMIAERNGSAFMCSGWVDFRPSGKKIHDELSPRFDEDIFGEAAIMVLAPCVADTTKIRIVVHISGDLTKALPYLNSQMPQASYNHHGLTFTFMDHYRMIVLYPRRITVAKADHIVDAWRVLEAVRRRVNETWARRAEIEPSYEMRERPPALEIFKRLPRTNCRQCGEATCLAFALRVWGGEIVPARCRPVFDGDYRRLKNALADICVGLGVSEK